MPAEVITAIVGLLSAIVGGLLTAGGTLVVHWLQQKDEKKKRQAEKFEELVAALYEHDHWLDKRKDIWVFGAKNDYVSAVQG